MTANENTVANIRRYADNYIKATEAQDSGQARFWLRKYEQAVRILGFDPLS